MTSYMLFVARSCGTFVAFSLFLIQEQTEQKKDSHQLATNMISQGRNSPRHARDMRSYTWGCKPLRRRSSLLLQKLGFSSSCPEKIFASFNVRSSHGESEDCSSNQGKPTAAKPLDLHQDIQRRKRALCGKTEVFQTRRQVVDWIRSTCQIEQPVEEIFALNGFNSPCLPWRSDPSTGSNNSPSPTVEYSTNKRDFAHGKAQLNSLDFDAYKYTPDTLVDLCMEIFYQLELDQNLGISREALHRFVLNVRCQMVENPYHNWFHVVDVAQTIYCLCLQSELIHLMSSKEIFSLIVAALCHDLDHPGVDNAFLIKTQSALASQYGMHASCLEKHHSSRASELLSNSNQAGLLDALAPDQREEILERVQSLILATDMSRHQEYMSLLRSMIDISSANRRPDGEDTSRQFDDEQRRMVAEVLIKCADMSNVLKPFSVAKQWAVRITDEFFNQGDLERSLGMAVTPLCDRQTQSRVSLQKGFCAFIAPFYDAVGELLPPLGALAVRLRGTRNMWEGYRCDEELLAEKAGHLQLQV